MTTNEKPLHIAQAEGLRALADLIAANPEIAKIMRYPLANMSAPVTRTGDQVAELAAFMRTCSRAGASVRKDGNDKWFRVVASFGPAVTVDAFGDREEVCERVQVGEETITKTVPDPAVEVPMVEITETVPKYEWQCGSLLAAEKDTAVTA